MRVLVAALLWLTSCLVARAVAPIPELDQAAKAMEIINAYKGQRPAQPPKKLHVVYFTPSDREAARQYQERLGAIMEDIRGFYRDGMEKKGFGPETFAMDYDAQGMLVIHMVKGSDPEASFPSWKDRPGTGDPAIGGSKVQDACQQTLKSAGISFDTDTVLIFCNLAAWDEKAMTFRHHSPYYGRWSQTGGLCFAADSEILNLNDISKQTPVLVDQEYGAMSLGKFETIFIGGVAHELGHAFALPHCGERWDERAMGTSIMGNGNHTYREERRGEGRGSFLTMASAMRLASHPLFSGSDKGYGQESSLQQCDLNLSTNVTRADLAGSKGALRVEGCVRGSPPVYGIVAYFDSAHDGGYSAPTATSVPDATGQFAIEVSDLAPCGSGELRIEFCHANGGVSERRLGFSVSAERSVDISQWQLRQALEPVARAVAEGQLTPAQSAAADIEKSQAPELEKLIARNLVATLQNEPKPVPAAVASERSTISLSDTQPVSAKVGWLEPAANRVPKNSEIPSPLLDFGKLYATGLYAHSPSQYVFDLGGKWKMLRGEAGLHSAFQGRAYGVIFSIKVDGKEAYRSAPIRGSEKGTYEVSVAGAKTLELIVDKAEDQNGGNWGLWLDPVLSR
jgi:hypothetical protein